MSRVSVAKISTDSVEDINVKKDDGQFTFSNGDAYVGGYMIIKDKQFISKQDLSSYYFTESKGRGIYVTEDFNKYEAHWVEDQIVREVNICHNNGTQYKGTLGIDGGMSGFGTYTFTDNSVLEATWEQNKPVADIILREPLGLIWKGECDGKEISFTDGNHFWDEISPAIDHAKGEEDEKHLDIGQYESES